MSSEAFRFKQFTVEQDQAALKVNTDAVLLGALAGKNNPKTVLDVGTGNGVIALMLAQRFKQATVDAVEIDVEAANAARLNFQNSPFADRLRASAMSFSCFLKKYPQNKYDLIVSNPPFFIEALKSHSPHLSRSKHTDIAFFAALFSEMSGRLSANGEFWLILPPDVYGFLSSLMLENGWHMAHFTRVFSRPDKRQFRTVICLKRSGNAVFTSSLSIKNIESSYTSEYRNLLSEFLIIF